MHIRFVLWGVVAVVVFGVALPEAQAQNNQFTERAFVASPSVRGMGDAGVALPGPERGFFYNPAHLPHVASHFTIMGLQGAVSPSLDDNIRFLNQQLGPAVAEAGAPSGETLATLRREAEALQARPGRGAASVLLPNFVYAPGALAIGGGVFAKTATNYRLESEEGMGASVWALNRTDLMAVVALGLDLRVIGLPGLTVGATGTQTRRYLAFKHERLSSFQQTEYAVQLQGGTFQLDGGVTYRLDTLMSMPGALRVGAAVYDVLPSGYDYVSGGAGRLPFLNDIIDTPTNGGGATPAETRRARQQFALAPSYRVGVAYDRARLGGLEHVGVAVDYQGTREGEPRALASKLHAGVRARVLGPIELRAGVSAGYPTGGVGIEWRAVHLDYALYGMEEGRQFRQRRAYVHTARLLLRLE